ncbi:F0F1 ATP synthase subunit gamma [Henriciella aquimarina]|uniref:F0F1 ATP synthase subunit gamma n=1 Tax=Henriciella aquimarina TaxID=545261 RepID=UPI00117A54FC|nr:FoF1 ATP synthase subunit gamma [Henriciella aquimarina]
MSTLEQMLRKEKTGEDLRSVVRVMKSLSAVSIRQYDAAVSAMLDYHEVVDLGLQALLREATLSSILVTPPPEASPAYIIVGSDRGLCGRFNDTVAERTAAAFAEGTVGADGARILTVGIRAEGRIMARDIVPNQTIPVPNTADAIGETVQTILMWLDEQRESHQIGEVRVIYNRRTTQRLAETVEETLLPVTAERLSRLREKPWPTRGLPSFTAEPEALFSKLTRELVFLGLFKAVGESLASEHASRLAAMQRAEHHIEDYLSELGTSIREERQNSITQQLLDIVASYAIMKERAEDTSRETHRTSNPEQ